MPPADALRAGLVLAALATLVLILFAVWPGLDLALSGLFYRPGAGFAAQDQPLAEAFRQAVWNLSIGLVVASALCLVAALAGYRALGLPPRLWVFILSLYALSTGVLVNGILKAYWGRARPAQVTEFGGDARFTPAWQVSDQCESNCSFVSGEVSGTVALSVGLWLILDALAPRLGPGVVRLGRVIALALPVLVALQRVASGRHFVSDAVLSALFTLMVAAALSPLLPPRHGRRG